MDYTKLIEKIEVYKQKYDVKIIGESLFKRKIFAVEKVVDPSLSTAILVASCHAREHITTDLVCKFLDDGLFDEICEFNVSVVLMENPDGVELCCHGLKSAPLSERDNLIDLNQGSFDFSMWKSNGRGVDINNNFDARFGTNVHSLSPAPSGYAGKFAESEPESKCVADYIKKKNAFLVLCYHSKGEELYYNFFQTEQRLERDKIIAERFAESTGYLIKNPEEKSSGGLKDYCVARLKIPSITMEIGSDSLSHPIQSSALESIFERHKNIANDLKFAYNVFIKF